MPSDHPGTETPPPARRGTEILWGLAVYLIALGLVAVGTPGTFAFVDEWAFVSQAYFAPEFLRPSSLAWLEYPAIDLPPLPKYLVAAGLTAAGYPLPGRPQMAAWYADTHSTFGPHALLVAARWPMAAVAALGVLATYALGRIVAGRAVGLLAAAFLLANRLYLIGARRAMADVPVEAFSLAALAALLLLFKSQSSGHARLGRMLAAAGAAGLLAALAISSKLTGLLVPMIAGAWGLIALVDLLRPRRPGVGRLLLAGALFAAATAAGTIALNPLLWGQRPTLVPPPLRDLAQAGTAGRFVRMIQHRMAVSRSGQAMFPDDATRTLDAKLAAVAVQGFGRFGLLGRRVPVPPERRIDPERQLLDYDSRIRYDLHQDLGAALWAPLVLAGGILTLRRGLREWHTRAFPTHLFLVAQAAVVAATVTLFLPLAWDRYFLPLQPVASLLAACAVAAAARALVPARNLAPAAPDAVALPAASA